MVLAMDGITDLTFAERHAQWVDLFRDRRLGAQPRLAKRRCYFFRATEFASIESTRKVLPGHV